MQALPESSGLNQASIHTCSGQRAGHPEQDFVNIAEEDESWGSICMNGIVSNWVQTHELIQLTELGSDHSGGVCPNWQSWFRSQAQTQAFLSNTKHHTCKQPPVLRLPLVALLYGQEAQIKGGFFGQPAKCSYPRAGISIKPSNYYLISTSLIFYSKLELFTNTYYNLCWTCYLP